MASIAKFDSWQNSAGVARQTPLQVVQSTQINQFESSATEVDLQTMVSLTPSSASNKILICMHSFSVVTRTGSVIGKIWVQRRINGGSWVTIQSPANYIGQYAYQAGAEVYPNMMYLDSPNTTQTVDYRLLGAIASGSGTIAWNHNNTDPGDSRKKMTLIAMEISQ